MIRTLIALAGASVLAVQAAPHHAASLASKDTNPAGMFALSAPRFTQCPTYSGNSLNSSTIAQVSGLNSTTVSTLYCYYNPEGAHTCAYNADSGAIVSGAGTGCPEITKGCYTTCAFKKSADKRTFTQVAVTSGQNETACFVSGDKGDAYQCVFSTVTGNFTAARNTQNATLCDSVMVEQGATCITLN